MSFADDVREYCKVHYVEPARARGEATVTIRTGDVHSALGYKSPITFEDEAKHSPLWQSSHFKSVKLLS